MAEIVITRQAEDDFERIWLNIALDNDAAADRLLRAINTKIERLRNFSRNRPDTR